jgi:hypothetical protein
MSIIYIHGVKVRSPDHGVALGKPFARWLAPKLAVGGAPVEYVPVYWGDVAARFRWDLAARPKTAILRAGGADAFAGLGSLREAAARTPLDAAASAAPPIGPVLGGPAAPAAPAAPPLASIPRERRADFIADLYLAVHPRSKRGEDPVAEDAHVAPLADAAAEVAGQWDAIVVTEATDAMRAARFVSEVEKRLTGSGVLAQGGFAEWMIAAGEAVRRAAVWPGDAVSTVFAELRPVVNEFVAYFIGDVLAYMNERDAAGAAGTVPRRVLEALRRAHQRKQATGERSSSSPTPWEASCSTTCSPSTRRTTKAAIDRIAGCDKYDRDVAGHALQVAGYGAADGQQRVGRLRDELRRVGAIALPIACAPAIVDLNIAAGYPPVRLQRVGKGRSFLAPLHIAAALVRQHTDAPHTFALLRTRRDRPSSRCAGKTSDEIASPHGRCPSAEGNTLAHHGTSTAQCGTAKALMSALGQKRT